MSKYNMVKLLKKIKPNKNKDKYKNKRTPKPKTAKPQKAFKSFIKTREVTFVLKNRHTKLNFMRLVSKFE